MMWNLAAYYAAKFHSYFVIIFIILIITSVSEMIRKPLLVKVQTALRK